MRENKTNPLIVILPIVVLLAVLYALPPVRERVNRRLEDWRTRLAYTFFPPEREVFVPQKQVETLVQATMMALTLTPTPEITVTPTAPVITIIPTQTPTPLPAMIELQGVPYVDQHFGWNMCSPATLTMALQYWQWPGKREEAATGLKPFEQDKNVMLYEMATFAQQQSGMGAVWRSGGTLDLLKELLAAGFPVIIEKGTYGLRDTLTGKYSWMGHYNLVTGYDDAAQQFIIQDSYLAPGANIRFDYTLIEQEWRAFNFGFLVVYPADQQKRLFAVLDDYGDEVTSDQKAYQRSTQEIYSLTGPDQVFAWFNRGSSLVRLQDYAGAAEAYDEAFRLIAELPEEKRPYRLVWYQTGPYFAYYYAGRYQDVINLADATLTPVERSGKPYLEESYYWRAKAKLMIGDQDGAVADLKKSIEYHPNFSPAMDELKNLGVTTP